ncbi:MAG: CBS domain-containing protein, partial [Chlamydiae bacterium]|nr:CBS domain-containing protein [Chlamydiota bacterium]
TKMSTAHLLLPIQRELCTHNLVPTTSSEVQLLFGDVLAIALMREKRFLLEHYAKNHPLGAIGKKMTLRVRDLMIQGKELPLCQKSQTLSEVLVDLTQKKCGILLVVDEESRLEGVFTDGDLRRSLQRFGAHILQQKIADLMTAGAIFVHPDILAWEAMKIMQRDANRWVMVVPVIYEETVVGLLRMHDIIHAGLSET